MTSFQIPLSFDILILDPNNASMAVLPNKINILGSIIEICSIKKFLYLSIEKFLSIKTDVIINISDYEFNESIKLGINREENKVFNGSISEILRMEIQSSFKAKKLILNRISNFF